MRKYSTLICSAALLFSMTGCSHKYIEDTPSTPVVTAPAVTETTTEQPYEPVTVPRENIEPKDFIGKWTAVKIVDTAETAEDFWHDIPIDSLFRLEVNEDNSGSMKSCTLGEFRTAQENPVSEEMTESETESTTETAAENVSEEISDNEPPSVFDIPDDELFRDENFTWNAENGRMTLDFGDGKSIYGKIKNGSLIISSGMGMKIYFQPADKFEDIDTEKFKGAASIEPDAFVPSSSDLFAVSDEITADDVIGKWECCFYSTDGENFDGSLYGMPLKALFHLEIFADNTAVSRVGGSDADAEITEYKWEINENGQVFLYYSDDSEFDAAAEIHDGLLYLEEGTDSFRYKKIDKFTDFDWDTFADESINVTGA